MLLPLHSLLGSKASRRWRRYCCSHLKARKWLFGSFERDKLIQGPEMEMNTKTPKSMYSFASMKTFSIWPLRYTCSLVDRALQTSLPGKSQCGCIARMGRGSAAQGSGREKVIICSYWVSCNIFTRWKVKVVSLNASIDTFPPVLFAQ